MSWVIITMAIVDMDGSCQFSADSEPKSIGFVWVSIRVISNDLGWPWRPFACYRTSPSSLLLNCPVRQRQPRQHGALQILYRIVLYCIVSNAIQRTFMRHFARFLLIRRVARSLGDSWASYVIIIIIIIITDGKWGLLKYCFLACF